MTRLLDLKQKEVINIKDGTRYGFVCDIEFEEKSGTIKSLIVPVSGKGLSMLKREQEYVIPWEEIKKIGDDIILIDGD